MKKLLTSVFAASLLLTIVGAISPVAAEEMSQKEFRKTLTANRQAVRKEIREDRKQTMEEIKKNREYRALAGKAKALQNQIDAQIKRFTMNKNNLTLRMERQAKLGANTAA